MFGNEAIVLTIQVAAQCQLLRIKLLLPRIVIAITSSGTTKWAPLIMQVSVLEMKMS